MKRRPRYHQISHRFGRFSEWIILAHRAKKRIHKTACCDCGLVHIEQYRAALVVRRHGKVVQYKPIPISKVVVMRRLQRDDRATAARRRAKKHAKVRKALRRGG